MKNNKHEYHRFLDEAGDTTFYGKGKIDIVGNKGVSKSFLIGMIKFKEPLENVRIKLLNIKDKVLSNIYLNSISSIKKKLNNDIFYFHATDDPPEVRMIFYDFIKSINCSFEAIVGRKIPAVFDKKHMSLENEFYADILSHLLKNKFATKSKLILNISERGSSTNNKNLDKALHIAQQRAILNRDNKEIITNISFNIRNHSSEPLLNIADYFCWAVQRVFERGETRYYDYISDKISLVIDLYDATKYENWGNYYGPKNKLNTSNMIK
ncbi:MAG: hypothetical protein HW421_4016 [Ignavibacteria bacterium]|nr:hypothetical protein [Ignavibacteria bacterium]